MALNEPTALPSVYDDWKEHRADYAAAVAEYNASAKGPSDELRLEIRLRRLGFGRDLPAEIRYIKEGGE